MYLTRFQINPGRNSARRLLASPQRMHAAVLSSLPSDASSGEPSVRTLREQGRVLWRVDPIGPQVFLLIVSPTKPDLTHLVEQAGWPTLDTGWETRDYNAVLDRIETGQRWAFRITGNPVHSLAAEPGQKRGRVVAHRTVEHQLGWLASQGERHGFTLVTRRAESLDADTGEVVTGEAPTTRVTRSEVVKFRRESSEVTLRIAGFDGVLEVTDAEAFRSALRAGIGPARAYGCGLLTIAPVG